MFDPNATHIDAHREAKSGHRSCAAATNRTPRGTKIVAQAPVAAAQEVPDNRRDGVVKAALSIPRN